MPRRARVVVPRLPHHVIHRGHNKAPLFIRASDYRVYLSTLAEWKATLDCRVYAFCLMTNHVHLVIDPGESAADLARLMKRVAGRYTRYGNVTSLLTVVDDCFVIIAPGDEIAIDFPAIELPELPEGWSRDYLIEAEGWIKDADLRTRTGDTVAPLPHHQMTGYPDVGEGSPEGPRFNSYLERFQTRMLPPWTRPTRRP